MDGAICACKFIDRYYRFAHVAGLNSKAYAVYATKSYKDLKHVQKYFQKEVERLHTDGRGEFENMNVHEHSETTPYTPQQNAFAERLNRTILERLSIMLDQAGLSG